ncbi:aminotransferase class I/II-fold pyridoxal phosphate-dependent enzyme [Butyrivibrio sp. CB08]|uniref:pyridoxal phosphate-dependent aminotransferase n=1 Tax=Butyrivibrio sp. CB08 TaxID=2364879 RepID=UPI000EA9CA39|nr:aminotransferase class I/II-fold pyridoxal phosphate-dependent enzyme [Butyrivibrio sp. CB08]RKM59749.1 aminotransferase class I/II-fold pyridoxal phosphate-dependent enzyme [Butyrivibrio sp. CB08]
MLHGGEIYDKRIDLDFSVSLNPYPCPEEVKKALTGAVCDVDKYPDMDQRNFRQAVARAEGVDASCVIGGNGASELLSAIAMLLSPKKALLPVPSFYGYVHALGMVRECETATYQLSEDDDFELTMDFVGAITEDVDLVILGNPNNPTGRCVKKDVFEAVLKRCKEAGAAVLVDECFYKLSDGQSSARAYIGQYDNLYVVDAYTKLFSIPGVRVGSCLSQAANVERLRRFLPEWNMSAFAEAAGVACANILAAGTRPEGSVDPAAGSADNYIQKSLDMIREERSFLTSRLLKKGIKVFYSDTNFVLLRGSNLYEKLLDKHILIRDCATFEGLPEGYYRIAVKDHVSNERLIEVL